MKEFVASMRALKVRVLLKSQPTTWKGRPTEKTKTQLSPPSHYDVGK